MSNRTSNSLQAAYRHIYKYNLGTMQQTTLALTSGYKEVITTSFSTALKSTSGLLGQAEGNVTTVYCTY